MTPTRSHKQSNTRETASTLPSRCPLRSGCSSTPQSTVADGNVASITSAQNLLAVRCPMTACHAGCVPDLGAENHGGRPLGHEETGARAHVLRLEKASVQGP